MDTIKRLIVVMTMSIIVFTLGIILIIMYTTDSSATVSETYPTGTVRQMQAKVIETNSFAILKDECNNLWSISVDELSVNDVVCVWLDDMNTPKDLTDDVILKYVIINSK